MSDSRSRSRDTIDIEMDPASRNVRQRHSPIPDDPYLGEPSHIIERSDSSVEPFEDEDPSEDEEASLPAHSRTPSPLPAASPPLAIPSPLPSPIASPAPIAPPSPIAPPTPICPSLRFASRNQGTPLRWDWMPTILRWWRNAEQLPVIPIPRSRAPIPAFTQEPAHHTIPVIIARLRTHDEQMEDIEHGAEDLQQQLAGVEGDLSELRDEVVTTHVRETEDREEIAALRQEVAALRQELAEMRAERDQARADAA